MPWMGFVKSKTNKMDIKKTENKVEISVTASDVESAIRQFICTCHPELAIGWTIDPQVKYNLGVQTYIAIKGD
jgi:hypothetical protein